MVLSVISIPGIKLFAKTIDRLSEMHFLFLIRAPPQFQTDDNSPPILPDDWKPTNALAIVPLNYPSNLTFPPDPNEKRKHV